MNLSSILIETELHQMNGLIEDLSDLPNTEVHFTDPNKGRIVVTLEAESVAAEVEGLQRIKALPQVLYAEMVYHYFENETEVVVPLSVKN